MRITTHTPVRHSIIAAVIFAFFAFMATYGTARKNGESNAFYIGITWAGIGGMMGFTVTMAFSADRPTRTEIVEIKPLELPPVQRPQPHTDRVLITHNSGPYMSGDYLDLPQVARPKLHAWAEAILMGKSSTTYDSMLAFFSRQEANIVRMWLLSNDYAERLGDGQVTLNDSGEGMLATLAGYQPHSPTRYDNALDYDD